MTTNELKVNIGKTGTCQFDSIRGPVTVIDTRKVFGRIDYLIQIVGGSGQQWVSSDRVTVSDERKNTPDAWYCNGCGIDEVNGLDSTCSNCGRDFQESEAVR